MGDANLSADVAEALARLSLPTLARGTPAPVPPALAAWLADPATPPACRAGALVALDRWDEAHALAQDLDTPDGSYWHAILHRREPDAFNAKYWYARVRRHPVQLAMTAEAGYGDGAAFVGRCEAAPAGELAELLALQMLEWRRLMTWCAGESHG